MDLYERRYYVFTLNLICNILVLFWESVNDELNLIFQIICFAKYGQLVKSSDESLHIVINCLVSLLPFFDLLP